MRDNVTRSYSTSRMSFLSVVRPRANSLLLALLLHMYVKSPGPFICFRVPKSWSHSASLLIHHLSPSTLSGYPGYNTPTGMKLSQTEPQMTQFHYLSFPVPAVVTAVPHHANTESQSGLTPLLIGYQRAHSKSPNQPIPRRCSPDRDAIGMKYACAVLQSAVHCHAIRSASAGQSFRHSPLEGMVGCKPYTRTSPTPMNCWREGVAVTRILQGKVGCQELV